MMMPIPNHHDSHHVVECWELKINLPPPSTIDFRREVEVTSINWESQDAAAAASLAFVSYRWHGIMYVIIISHDC
jgi:hypothetical protein